MMHKTAYLIRRRLAPVFSGLLPAVLFLLGMPINGRSQSTKATDGFTPEGLKSGAPAGSFQLSGFDNINYFNGNLNFSLPLLHVGGRGGTGYTIPLRIERKWLVTKTPSPIGSGSYVHTPEPNDWESIDPGYSPGVLIGRVIGLPGENCHNVSTSVTETLTRLTFIAGDGTEYQLRDTTSLNGGSTTTSWSNCDVGVTWDRGKVFISDDGSGVTFVSDADIFDAYNGGVTQQITPSGYLMMPDGSRYRIEEGRVIWIRDRNGNKTSFGYGPGGLASVTDSLNRQVTIAYLNNGTQYYDEITYKGFGGASRIVRVWYNWLSQALKAGAVQHYYDLFQDLSNTEYTTTTLFDQWVASAVELPDGRSYQFKYNNYGELARVELPTGGAIEYDYLEGIVGASQYGSGVYHHSNGQFINPQVYRRVTERRVYADKNSSVFESKMLISRPETPPDTGGNLGYVDVVNYGYPGNIFLTKERHYYYGSAKVPIASNPAGYSEWKTGKEWKTEIFTTEMENALPLQTAENTWQQPQNGSSWPLTQPETSDFVRPNNPKITQTIKVLAETNQVSKQTFFYDKYFNQTDVYEYDFGSGAAPANATRRTHTDYLTINPVNNINYADPANTVIGYTASDYYIRSLPEKQVVYSVNPATGAETKAAQTDYEYDKYDSSNYHAGLTTRPNISGLCDGTQNNCSDGPNFTSAGFQIRGNVTEVKRYSAPGSLSGAITTYQQYDIAGNVVKTIDSGRSDGTRSMTTIEYDDRFGAPDGEARQNTPPTNPNWLNGQNTFAFATKVTNALGHETFTQYDYFLGKPVNSEDINGVVSSISYDDILDRPKEGISAFGIPVSGKTVFSYDDAFHNIATFGDQVGLGDGKLQSKLKYDGLGRTIRQGNYEGNGVWIATDTQYDALGRSQKVSSPYRTTDFDATTPAPITGTLVEWTTTQYDALGRVIEVKTPDNARVTTTYSGNRVLVTDQARQAQLDGMSGTTGGAQRISQTDALGRLTSVWEVRPAALTAGTVSVTFPNHPEVAAAYETDYTYDALGNLIRVRQGGFPGASSGNIVQTRAFLYDSLSRLLYASNPEQDATIPGPSGTRWTMKYEYDPNGNLTKRTDARNVVTDYTYDGLNRNTKVCYSDGTLPVFRSYDPNQANGDPNVPYSKGRLWKVENRTACTSGSATRSRTTINAFDALGRVASQTQSFATGATPNWTPYLISRTYNLAGQVTQQTYPSGHTANYVYYDNGLLRFFHGNLGAGTHYNYVSSIFNGSTNQPGGTLYNAAGQMTQEYFGTTENRALYHHVKYNNRFQMTETLLGAGSNPDDSSAWTRGKLVFDYGTINNNGNVLKQEHYVPTNVSFGNTPTSPGMVISSVIPMRDTYEYDALNRLTKVTGKQVGSSGESTIYHQAFTYDPFGNRKIDATNTDGLGINNKVYEPNKRNNRLNGLVYDAAGNVINESYTFRLSDRKYDAENRMTQANVVNSYVYDGDGRRVRRIVNGTETWQVYGIDGELLAEYAAGAVAAGPQKEYGYRNGQLLIVAETSPASVKWIVSDHLGTPRIIVDATGGVVNANGSLSNLWRHDYLPFGEELTEAMAGGGLVGGMRSAGNGYAADVVRQKFTGEERDVEAGLDYFLARYYSNTEGRFTGPDLPFIDQFEREPQSWNLYTYVRNNPCVHTDRRGRETCYYSRGSKIGCEGDSRIRIESGNLIFTPKRGAPIIYDLNSIEAKFIVRPGPATIGDLAFEMNRRAHALNKFGEVGGMVAVGLVAFPVLGLTGGGGLTTIGVSSFPAMTNVPGAQGGFAVLYSFSEGLPSIANLPNAIVLQTTRWTAELNMLWLRQIIARRIPVFVGSVLGGANRLFNQDTGELKELGREIYYLVNHGYALVQNAQGYWLQPPK